MEFRYLYCKTYELATAITTVEGDREKIYRDVTKNLAELIYKNNPELAKTDSIEIIVKTHRAQLSFQKKIFLKP